MSETPEDFFPKYFVPGINEGDDWRFQDKDTVKTIADDSGHIGEILNYSNGHSSLKKILGKFEQDGVDPENVAKIIRDLRQLGILIDSREIAIEQHDYTNNPQVYPRALSSQDVLDITYSDPFEAKRGSTYSFKELASFIGNLSMGRESCRDFSANPLEPEKIMTCLTNAYSKETHPIPSAGGLYPLRMYVIQKAHTPQLPKGLYQYDHDREKLVYLENKLDQLDLSYVFGSEDLLHNAPTIAVIAADLGRQNAKYGNRGYRYTLLEAGHSAQNIHLTARELGIATLEFGGFRDGDLADVFGMSKNERPMVTIAMGYQNTDYFSSDVPLDIDAIKGADKPVEWTSVDFTSPVSKLLRFYKAVSKFRKPNSAYSNEENLFAFGTAASPQLAEIKATAEAYERYVAGQVRYDIFEKATDLGEGQWLSPHKVRPRSEEQHHKSSYSEQFDPNKAIHWILGNRADGSNVYIPIDLVFYPIDIEEIGRPLVAEVDSSGMAAHTNYETAAKGALLELVERDAIMRTWFSQESPSKVDLESLPLYYQKRAQFWKKLGKTLEVLDLSHNDMAIALVVIRSQDKGGYPLMVNGASASIDSFEEALKKASHEAELGAAECVTSEYKVKKLSPDKVFSPADHANFYAHSDYSSEIEWLWQGPIKPHATEVSGNKDLFQAYNPILVRLTKEDDPLQVVRVIVPDLIPISFGYGNEVFLHPGLNQAKNKTLTVPHFFA